MLKIQEQLANALVETLPALAAGSYEGFQKQSQKVQVLLELLEDLTNNEEN